VRFNAAATRLLGSSDWPGNVRELENIVGRGVLRASFGRDRGQVIEVDASDLDVRPAEGKALPANGTAAAGTPAAGGPLGERVERFEREAILDAVRRNGGNWAAAARELGLHRSNLHHRALRLGLKE
jgi:anaerobic nitric oxide reductase transcription regulator